MPLIRLKLSIFCVGLSNQLIYYLLQCMLIGGCIYGIEMVRNVDNFLIFIKIFEVPNFFC